MTTIILSGGIGKHIAFSALIPKLVEKYGKLNILSAYPDLFAGVDGIKRSADQNNPFGYEDYLRGNDVFWPDPYKQNDFFNKKIHLIEAFAKELNIEYVPKTDKPTMPIIDELWTNEIDKLKKQVKNYIVVQFTGGNHAVSIANGSNKKDAFMVKNYPEKLVAEFVTKFKEKYRDKYKLVNAGLPKYEGIKDIINIGQISEDGKMKTWMPYISIPYLLQKSDGFIAIDSCVQHMAEIEAVNKKGIVLWGSSSPDSFGYKKNINLTNCTCEDKHCTRPYFYQSSDFVAQGKLWQCKKRTCIKISPIKIIGEIDKMLGKKSKK